MKKHRALLLFLTLPLLAQTRFDGTWEMKMDTLQFSGGPEQYLLDKGVYHCLTCAPKVDVKMDGNDQKVVGHAYFDSIAVRVVDTSSVEFAMKKEGKPTFACTETVAPDGKTMIEDFTDDPASQQRTGKATFVRVAEGPPGSHALSGSWEMRTIKNVDSKGPTTTYRTTKDGIRVSAGASNFEAKFDSNDYPTHGDTAHILVSLTRIDDDTIEQTEKQDGKVVRVTRMTVSKDGKSMKVESIDKQLGRTATYTAEKQP